VLLTNTFQLDQFVVSGNGLEGEAMNTAQGQAARASYNRISRIYWLLSNGSEKKLVEVAIQQVLKPMPAETVLEPGFGAGQALAALAGMVGGGGKVYGIDISDGMVEATRRRLARKGLESRAELVRGDASKMPFENGFFDAVFMSFTLELFPEDEIPVVLSECARVLKGDGRICVACMSAKGKEGVMKRMYAMAHRKFPRFVDCRPIFAGEALESAGFDIVGEQILSMWGLPVEIVLGQR
jgi:ubiquinone/menaquinone biosynthesis C-methylase UbiE